MTHEDEIAAKAARISTLKSLKVKKMLRIQQIKKEAEEKIREINIQYAEDPERLRAKYAADDYAKSERAKQHAEKAIEKEKKHLEWEKKLRPYTLTEEIFSSIIQGIGACLFIAAAVLLDIYVINRVPSVLKSTYFVLYTCFGVLMAVNYVMSVLHHALTNSTAKEVFKRLSRAMIFIIISCAYTCYSFTSPITTARLIITICIWTGSFTGLMLYVIAGSRLESVNIIFYAVLGWSVLFICKQLYKELPSKSFGMLITAGFFFTVGLIFCSLRKFKYFHAIGNLISLTASIHLFFSFFYMFQ